MPERGYDDDVDNEEYRRKNIMIVFITILDMISGNCSAL